MMSLNLWKTVNVQLEIVNKNVELLQQNSSYLQKELTSNPIQMGGRGGGGQKVPRTSFSPVTSTNVEISPQNFLTFSFNPFTTPV